METKVVPSISFRKLHPMRTNRDTWYNHIRIDLIIGRLLGMVIIARNKNGVYTRSYASFSMLYAVFVLLLSSYVWYLTLTELLDHFHHNKVPGSYMLFMALFCHPLPILFIVESRKMPDFFNMWRKFEADFLERTGIELDFTATKLRNFGYSLKVFFSILFFVLQRFRFPVLTNRGIIFILYEYWILGTITSFWDILLIFLYKAGDALHELAKKLVRTKTPRVVTFEEVEVLWYDLYKLLKMTGRTFCFTYCYLILLMFLMLMVTAYETLIIISSPVLLEKTVFIVLTIMTTLHTASIPFVSQIAAKKVGEDFYKLLLDLKTKERSRGRRSEEMDGLIQAISDNQLTIDLGGFVTLDNRLITSLMNTMVTYLIVLVQFKLSGLLAMIPPMRKYLSDEEVLLHDLRPTDQIQPCRNLYLWLFRFLGLLVFGNGRSGRLESNWNSIPFVYCFSIVFFHLYIIFVTGIERNLLLNRLKDRSFNEDLFLYSQFAFFFFQGLPLILIFESGKLVHFFNSLAVFQARYYHVKGERLNLRFGLFHKYFFLAFIVAAFLVFFYVNFINIRSIHEKYDGNRLAPFVENIISTALIIISIIGTNILYLGNAASLTYVVSAFLGELTKAFEFGDERSFDDHERLWIDLMYIVIDLVNGMAYTVGYYFVVGILLATFEFFLAIHKDHADLVVYGVSLWTSMTVLIVFTDSVISKMTEHLKDRLIEVRKGVSRSRKHRISQFFRLVRKIGGGCSLAGFVTFDNGLASSVLNNITTYIIILLQFRKDNQEVG